MQRIDLTGQKFGLLSVICRSEVIRKSGAFWVCVCDCGETREVDSLKLRTGHTKSCGCRKNDGMANYRHGHSKAKTRTYRTWKEMRQRCMNPNSDKWQWYGGRGIKICDSWMASFAEFLTDMGDRPDGMTLDRIDPDGDYCKANCRWATGKQQAETNRGLFKPGLTPWNKTADVLRSVEKVKGVA